MVGWCWVEIKWCLYICLYVLSEVGKYEYLQNMNINNWSNKVGKDEVVGEK